MRSLRSELRALMVATRTSRQVRRSYPVRAEARSAADTATLVGYASVTDTPYEVHDLFGSFQETIQRGAFADTLAANPRVHLLVNHEGLALASTSGGTLRLEEDETGLRFEATLDPERTDAANLLRAVARGDVDQCSFAFLTTADEWDADYTERVIRSVDLDRGDVSVVNEGANPGTSVSLVEAQQRMLTLLREPRGAVAVHHTSTVDTPWDGGAAVKNLKPNDINAFRQVFAWYDSTAPDPDGDGYPDAKSAWKFPHHQVSEDGTPGAANLAGVRNALARLPQADIPEADRAGVEQHLRAHLEDARQGRSLSLVLARNLF